jgi:hypothetical protein
MSSTIVTAYYEIPSKASKEKYLPWIHNFLTFIEGNIVFFTTENLIEHFKSIRSHNIIYKILPFSEFNAIQEHGWDFWKRHKSLDPEPYHTPELGAIWYEKKEFVLRVIEENPFNTEYFIWCDAGCVRHESCRGRIKSFGQNLSRINSEKLNVQMIRPIKNKLFYRFPDVCIAGAIMIGKSEHWKNFKKLYDIVMKIYDTENVPVIMDQYIMVSIIEKFPGELNPIFSNKNYIDEWFFLLEDLSYN